MIRHTQPEAKEKRPKKKFLQGLRPLADVLKNLKKDIKSHPNKQFLKKFVHYPENGHVALVILIKDLLDYPTVAIKKTSKKHDLLQRKPVSHVNVYFNNNRCVIVVTIFRFTSGWHCKLLELSWAVR